MFDSLFEKYRNNIALKADNGEVLTYSELAVKANLLGKAIQYRSLIFCLCENTLESVVGYVSFINNNHVPLLLDAGIEANLLSNLLQTYQPNLIWLPKSRINEFPQCAIVYEEGNFTLLSYKAELLYLNKQLALLLTTSGSTGSPKLVRLSKENLTSNAESIIEYLKIDASETPITSLPMYYSYGLSVINSHLLSGSTILLTNTSIMQKEFWDFAKMGNATSLSGVPYTYQMLKMLRFFRMDLPHLKLLTQAGGRLAENLVTEFVTNCIGANKTFVVMYGQTEATARMSYLPFEKALEKSGSIGIAIPGGEFYLVDADGIKINEINVDGELVYVGNNVSLGYAENIDDLSKGDENQGTLYTGDIAKMDADGYFYITGRKKRFVKLYGNRVNLDEVEKILNLEFSSCVVVGNDDALTVYITTQNIEDKVRMHLTSKTGINSRAVVVKYIEEIPKSSSGKILYANLNG